MMLARPSPATKRELAPHVRAMMNWALEGRAHEPTEILEDGSRTAVAIRGIAAGREGAVIGPFKLVKLLGQGGFGEVWMAEQSGHIRRTIALKLIKPGMASADVLRRFEAERQALAVMDHPNIARVLDAGATPEGSPWFAMELVDGCAITTWCDEHRLPIRERLRLFLHVCAAVEHAHQKGVLHRDLKPSNILVAEVDGQPRPRVIDFGIAKAVGSSPELMMQDTIVRTTKGLLIGTPEYMSPEQAGATPDLDTRSDIYMLGVLLFELLTGQTPLGRKQLAGVPFLEMLRRIREVDPARPSTCVLADLQTSRHVATDRSIEPLKLSRLLRGDLDWIVLKALEKDRGRRYATATDLADDIERHLNLETVTACPPSTFYRFAKMLRRNKVAAAAVVVASLSLLSGLGASVWQANQARQERDRAVRAEREAELRRQEAEKANATALEALDQAASEAATALAVKQFLHEDMLQNGATRSLVDRTEVLRPDLTLLQLLDNASVRVPERFKDGADPLLEAEIRTTLGLTYVNISKPKPAVAHLRKALDLRVKELGAEDSLSIESLRFLAEALRDAGEAKEAVALATQLLARSQTAAPDDEAGIIVAKETLAGALRAQGEAAKAVPLYEAALESKKKRSGPDGLETLLTMNSLAGAFMDQRQFDKALPLLEKANLALASNPFASESVTALRIKVNLATVYRELGLAAETVVQLGKSAYEGMAQSLGPDHPITLRAGVAYVKALHSAGKADEARAALQSVKNIAEKLLAEGDSESRQIEQELALLEKVIKPPVMVASVSNALPGTLGSNDASAKPAAATASPQPENAKAAAPQSGGTPKAHDLVPPASPKASPLPGSQVRSQNMQPGASSPTPAPGTQGALVPSVKSSNANDTEGAAKSRPTVPVGAASRSQPEDVRSPLRSGGPPNVPSPLQSAGPPNGRSVVRGSAALGNMLFKWSKGSWVSSSPVRARFSSDDERSRDVEHWVRQSAFPKGSTVSISPNGYIIVTPPK
jgi:serine/threonine protein kinase/tetratricopeptide (TPR) repeat protein